MPQTISLHFTPTPDDYASAIRTFYAGDKRFWQVVVALFPPLTACQLFSLVRGNFGDGLWSWMPALFLLLISALIVYLLVIRPLFTARQVKQSQQMTSPMSWRLSEDEVLVASHFTESKFDWSMYKKVWEIPGYYLLVHRPNERMFHFIPKRAFESPEQEIAFRDLLSRHVSPIESRELNRKDWAKIAAIGAGVLLAIAGCILAFGLMLRVMYGVN